MPTIQLNHNYKDHLLLGAAVGFWLVFFLIFIAPFDVIEFNFSEKLYLVPPYGFFVLASYLTAVFLQEKIYHRWKTWNLGLEIGVIGLTCLLNLVLTYFYYTLPFINGYFSLMLFLRLVYMPISILIISLLVFGRLFINRQVPVAKMEMASTEKIRLVGDNKNDVLQIAPHQIICISSAHNYVEVFYQQKDKINKHLIRNSLKKVAQDIGFLLQVHRSHFINPNHIVKWLDNKTLMVDEKKIPVSKTYRTAVIQHLLSVPKTAHLVPKTE